MKNSVTFSAIPSFAAYQLVACDSSSPEIAFESVFPEPHQDLRSEAWQIVQYGFSTNRQAAFITIAGKGDTLIFGPVAHYRGVYHVSQPQRDDSFYRYAVKIRSNFSYDLNSYLDQHYQATQQLT